MIVHFHDSVICGAGVAKHTGLVYNCYYRRAEDDAYPAISMNYLHLSCRVARLVYSATYREEKDVATMTCFVHLRSFRSTSILQG